MGEDRASGFGEWFRGVELDVVLGGIDEEKIPEDVKIPMSEEYDEYRGAESSAD